MRVLTAGTARACIHDLMLPRPLSGRPVTPDTPSILLILHSLPVLVGIGIGAFSLVGIMQADSYYSFMVWTCIHSITWAFTTPYIQSLLADMDPGGAVVTAGGLASGAGAGLGPAAAATFVTPNDYSGVLTVSMLAYLIAAIAIVVAARYLSTRQSG